MTADSRTGRPRASSRETLAEAACELFLEKGYEATSIAEIAQRAGVSRSSFFNYFASKGDILWAGLDERLAEFERRLSENETTDAAERCPRRDGRDRARLRPRQPRARPGERYGDGTGRRARARGVRCGGRGSRARSSERLRRGGADRLHADVAGAAYGGAVLAALDEWAHDGAGRTDLERDPARRASPRRAASFRPRVGQCVSCAWSCRRRTSTRRSRSTATCWGCRRPRRTRPRATRAW